VPLTRLAQTHGLKHRTLQRWIAEYRRSGLAGLVRRPRSDVGTRQLPADLQQLIEGLALQRPAPSAAAIHRRVAAVAQERGWPEPSYGRVAAIVRQLDPALVTLAQAGTKAYQQRFDLLFRREASRPNEIWQADHTAFDIWVRDEQGQSRRPWLTAIIDDYSRAIAGWRLGFEAPSALRTALTLRQAIWPKGQARWPVCGIPETFYTDHGRDFTSYHLEQTAADLKMRLVFSTVGQPRGRGRIERFFETVNQLFLSSQPGYTPAGLAPPAPPPLTLADLETRLSHFVVEGYHHRIHSETGVAPKERWEAGGFLPRLPESLEQLDLLLLTVPKPRQVGRDGIRFAGFRYVDLTLAAYIGEAVVVRYDPRDLAEIRVYYRGRFLCRAICQEIAGQTLSLQEVIRARNARRRDLRQFIAARVDIADQLLARPVAESSPPAENGRPRLKRYFND
jgi:putative transposase